jgi:hypothetical protein
MSQLILDPPARATPRQNDLARAWNDPACTRLLASGAIRSGKTQAAGRLLVETALQHPALYLVARATYRELKDSTQRALLNGDGGLPPLIPPEVVEVYRASDELVKLRNGSEIIFRSLEENATEKIRNLSLGAVLVDQIEELRYQEGEKLYDELLGRLSDRRGPRKLLAVANPAGLDHWLYRRFIKEPDAGTRMVHFTMRDNAENLPEGYVDQMEATKDVRPGWFRTFVLGEWGAIEDAAYTIDQAHLVGAFPLEDAFDRYEAADYGFNGAPWALCATDFDGNLVFVDMLYEKELLPSELCPLVLAKRRSWGDNTAYMDPSVWHRTGTLNKMGDPLQLADEFSESGVPLVKANNDPRAGMARLRELLRLDSSHRFPAWHPRYGELGAPRVFFTEACQRLIDELRSAPLQPLDKRNGGEIVDPEWESRNGHAAAMARYAAMVKADASEEPEPYEDDPRKRHVLEMFEAQRQEDEWVDEGELDPTLIPSNWN